ncbi:2OG-Fe(II) oxygenase [Flavobacterium sp. SUN046]|uniref:2OG-Fe(II) oxygenase n=1 Tax=Flavobacterium sp. SUN046 TaxID=3002440 RepID=UPI002DBD1D88|nr:2OG-Fe(II) oxygenase [Flavobacterium sp. SUN046]MEC4050123.1 2OG-Fe(II) oxygenase [Flavobacterium sp. SUN046]
MDECFEDLITSYITQKVGISDCFITEALAANLADNLLQLNANQLLQSAGIGNALKHQHNDLIRNDRIYWLDKSHNDPFENEFFVQIEAFIAYLNRSCFAGITSYEFHYSLYEKGAFYGKHLDQFQDNSSRQFSLISYLNPHWKPADGGELLIYQQPNNQIITPTHGKTVFFKSNEIPHEVLVTTTRRLSITGWLKRA